MNDTPLKHLYLSETDKKIAGVCGGMATYFGTDAAVIRLGWIIATVLTGVVPGVIAYIIAAIVLPHEPTEKV